MTARNEPPWAAWAGDWRRTADPGAEMRVSDAERSEIAEALSRHYADGRLDQAEFDERPEKAMKAKTRADLAPLLTDLPRIGSTEAVEPPRRPRRVLGLVAIVVLLLLVANTATVFFHPHVPWLVIGVVVLLLARRSRHSHHRNVRYSGPSYR